MAKSPGRLSGKVGRQVRVRNRVEKSCELNQNVSFSRDFVDFTKFVNHSIQMKIVAINMGNCLEESFVCDILAMDFADIA